MRERGKTLEEMTAAATIYFLDEVSYDAKAERKFLVPETVGIIEEVAAHVEHLEELSEATLAPIFNGICEERGVKMVAIAQPVRVALTGGTVSPGIYEVMRILGREAVLRRLRRAAALVGSRGSVQ